MCEEECGRGAGTLLLSFLVGAALGSTLLLLFKQNEEAQDEISSKEDNPLFI